MKKFIALFALLFAVVATSYADRTPSSTSETGSTTVRPGRNVVRLRDGSSLMFVARGAEISNIEVRTATGQSIKFNDEGCSTCGNTQPPKPCNGEIRCSYSEKYKATICFCVPKLDISNGGGGTAAAVDYFLEIEGIKGESK